MDKYLSLLSTIAIDVMPVGNAKVAAALVYKGEIISIGVCSVKSHTLQKKYRRIRPWSNPNNEGTYRHAEIDALIKGQKRLAALKGSRGSNIPLKKCTMYVARVKRANSFATDYVSGMAKPCEGCMKALTEAGIVNIVYTEG